MRSRQTFLLTVMTPENETDSLRGRLKIISTGKSCTFTSLDELYQLIATEMKEDFYQRFSSGDLRRNSAEEDSLPS